MQLIFSFLFFSFLLLYEVYARHGKARQCDCMYMHIFTLFCLFFQRGIVCLISCKLSWMTKPFYGAAQTSGAGASYYLDCSRTRVFLACSRCGWGCLDIFISSIICLFFLPLSLGDGPILTEKLSQGPLKPK